MSMKLTPAAATSTRTSPAPGDGEARSSSSSTSEPPGLVTTTARMARILLQAARSGFSYPTQRASGVVKVAATSQPQVRGAVEVEHGARGEFGVGRGEIDHGTRHFVGGCHPMER